MRVVLAEDAVLLRSGLAALLKDAGFDVVGVAGDGDEAVRLVDELHPDVAVLDIRMPPSHTDEGLRAAHTIREQHPDVGVLVLSQYVETDYVLALTADGSRGVGYLLKDRVSNPDEFTDSLRRVASGGCVFDPEVVARLTNRQREAGQLDTLTDRERDVLRLMAEGRSNEAIGARLALSPKTIEAHIRSIFLKLGLPASEEDHRRVLAVLHYLRSSTRDQPA
ncbi:MAG: response regulator transcription factor [Actinomycetota bacterium]